MRTEQRTWTAEAGWSGPATLSSAQLVLLFGAKGPLADAALVQGLRGDYPKAHLAGSSTAGEIAGTTVRDGTLVLTAVQFDSSSVAEVAIDLQPGEDSRSAGRRLAEAIPTEGLRHVLVLADGQHVNGSDLVRGMAGALPAGLGLTGGLAGDGTEFQSTLTVSDDGAATDRVVAIAFYGDRLHVGFGSLGGWDSFGPQRVVTRSKANVLYELDGQPALALYKKYLGEHAAGLPATGLLFPLAVKAGSGVELTRTILGVDEGDQSLTFAGDVPQGAIARLMKANFSRLVDGAHGAADSSRKPLEGRSAQLALLISCVGRKLVLKQRVEEEVEAVREVLGPQATLAGFYSYGEICPTSPTANCELHNQTMTITTLHED